MSVPASLSNLVGHWTGNNRLWLSPAEPARESETTAIVAMVAQGRFISLQYTWAYDGAAQDGLLMIGYEQEMNALTAFWIDTFHMQDKFMQCKGTLGEQEGITLNGSYSAPPEPDWGWQIVIAPKPGGMFQLIMYNISPEGEAHLAVEASYNKKF